jgi:hypothetical protein
VYIFNPLIPSRELSWTTLSSPQKFPNLVKI